MNDTFSVLGHAKVINSDICDKYVEIIKDKSEFFRKLFYGKWNTFPATIYKDDYNTSYIANNIKDTFEYSQTMNIDINVYYYCEEFAVIGLNSKHMYFIPYPDKYLQIELLKDYSDYSIKQLRQHMDIDSNTNSLISSDLADKSPNNVKSIISDKQSQLNNLLESMDDIKQCKTEELSRLQKEIDEKVAELQKKKSDMLQILEQKKSEMNAMIENLNNQLFVLNTEIYGIRCFLGETVEFIKIRDGEQTPENQPIILFQKMHFLDEDMGKLCSLYNFDFKNIKLFEKFISVSDEALEMFCPSTKCVSLIKISRDNVLYARDMEYYNVISKYEVYHGNTIGILIRDGGNLYIGWTDDKMINFKDDMFYRRETKIVSDDSKVDVSSKEDIASRYFIFNILQGCLENSKLIRLPEGNYNFTNPNQYIVYSTADNWIVDNKYGNFSDMVNKYHKNINHKEGDMIISTQSLLPNSSRYASQYIRNDRGIGYGDRTHDVSLNDNTIYKINKIIDDGEWRLRYKEEGSTLTYYTTFNKRYNREELQKYIDDWSKRNPDEIIDKVYFHHDYQYFVSLKKEGSWYRDTPYIREPRANFEVYNDEFINLTFFNSKFIESIIVNNQLGSYNKNYAYLIRYLKTALEYLKQREVEEKELLLTYTNELPDDWMVELSYFKLNNDIHHLGVRSAKQFIKYLTSNSK